MPTADFMVLGLGPGTELGLAGVQSEQRFGWFAKLTPFID